jgi:hypothetical protein
MFYSTVVPTIRKEVGPMTKNDNRTSARVPVSKRTLFDLKSSKKGSETYDELLRRLMVRNIDRHIIEMTEDEKDYVFYRN